MSFEGLSSDYSWLSFLCVLFDVVLHDHDISRVYSFNSNDIHVSNICFNDACLHTLSTVISTWSKLCEIYFRICLLSRPEVVTEPALHRRFHDNFQWRHWHRSWHFDSSRFSTHYAMCFSGIFSPVNTEKTPRGSPVRARYGVSFVDS